MVSHTHVMPSLRMCALDPAAGGRAGAGVRDFARVSFRSSVPGRDISGSIYIADTSCMSRPDLFRDARRGLDDRSSRSGFAPQHEYLRNMP